MSRSTIPAPQHKAGDSIHGFVIDAVTELADIKARAYEATHKKTGARVLHVHCNDEENMFAVGFRTPPADSTGVAHILEHCVLAGSQKFPVKDAFNELGKRTLNTFLNAMTWPDRTIYPTCSAVRADYFNLAAVYADLVFNPLITKQTFQQEGHHFEFEKLDDPNTALKVTGVVYNEMKGAYSSPENVAFRYLQQHLIPDTCYGVDSGGDPDVIPDLTYENFVEFHRKFYSPSNARFLLYGDIDTADNLAFLETVLEPFDRVEVNSEIPAQQPWKEPRARNVSYPVGSDDDLKNKTFVTLAWLANETANVAETLELSVVAEALTGSAAGPVRKALIDSGLGQDIFPGGSYDADIRHGMFVMGLRGTDADKAETIENLILDTLKSVAETGLSKELIDASLHQIEFHGKEIKPPFPLMLLFRACPPWFFDGDPKAGLEFSAAVDDIRKKYAADPKHFDKLIQKWLIDNPHRLRLVVQPSNTLASDQEKTFAEKMAKTKAKFSPDQLRKIRDEAVALKKAQEQPDSPEALAALPTLDVNDIPRRVFTVPTKPRQTGHVNIAEHDVFTNGIGYVGLSFDIRDLADDDAVFLPLFGRATTGMGAAGQNYEQMATRIASKTGGIGTGQFAGKALRTGNAFDRFTIDGKVLARNAGDLVAILRDLLLASDTTDHKRLKDLILEAGARASSRIVPAGHMFAFLRAAAPLGHHLYRREQWEGASQVRFLKDLAKSLDENVGKIADTIARLQKQIFTRARVAVNLAGDPEVLDSLRPMVDEFLQSLPEGEPVNAASPAAPSISRDSGVVIPAQVNYVGQVLPMPNFLDASAPALELLAQIVSSDFLYKKLRVQGGAYGGFCFYSGEAGLLPLLSYRDPHLTETFDVYAKITDWLKSDLTDDAVEGSRIGTIGSFDRILSPEQQLDAARRRYFYGITDDDRKAFRDGLFTVNAKQIIDAALPHVEKALADAPRAALASREKLTAANEKLARKLDLFSIE